MRLLRTAPPVYTVPAAYTVSCLPPDHPSRRRFEIVVERRWSGVWAVRHGDVYASRGGDWSTVVHRFPLVEALRIAERLAPKLTRDGLAVTDLLTRGAA